MKKPSAHLLPKTEAANLERFTVEPYKRFFAVKEGKENLVVVAVYRKGAEEVARRLNDASINGRMT